MKYEKVSNDPAIQAEYEAMRDEGTCHNLAAIFATRRGPAIVSDREFLHGHCNGSQFEKTPHVGDFYRKEAKRAGVDTAGKVYLEGLAAFAGDPEAWVGGRSDVKRVVEKRGWSCEGSVNVKAPPRLKEHEPVDLADDIVDNEVERVLGIVPDPVHVDVEDLREQIYNKHKPHWAKKPYKERKPKKKNK